MSWIDRAFSLISETQPLINRIPARSRYSGGYGGSDFRSWATTDRSSSPYASSVQQSNQRRYEERAMEKTRDAWERDKDPDKGEYDFKTAWDRYRPDLNSQSQSNMERNRRRDADRVRRDEERAERDFMKGMRADTEREGQNWDSDAAEAARREWEIQKDIDEQEKTAAEIEKHQITNQKLRPEDLVPNPEDEHNFPPGMEQNLNDRDEKMREEMKIMENRFRQLEYPGP